MSIADALLWSGILYWFMIFLAVTLKYRGWSLEGLGLIMSNRDEDAPAHSALAARSDRAAKNMMENLVLFVAIAAAVYFSNAENDQTRLGAAIFFWARLAYWPIFLAGIPGIRTATWVVSIIGIGIMASELI
jgi:uncharacterized MAPEG superfamily protein